MFYARVNPFCRNRMCCNQHGLNVVYFQPKMDLAGQECDESLQPSK